MIDEGDRIVASRRRTHSWVPASGGGMACACGASGWRHDANRVCSLADEDTVERYRAACAEVYGL